MHTTAPDTVPNTRDGCCPATGQRSRPRSSPASAVPPRQGKGGKRTPAAARRVAGNRFPPSVASGERGGPCNPQPILKGRERLRGRPGHQEAGGNLLPQRPLPPPLTSAAITPSLTSAAVTGRGAHWAPNDPSPQGRAAMPAPEPAPQLPPPRR